MGIEENDLIKDLSLLNNLNQQQKEAVLYCDSP